MEVLLTLSVILQLVCGTFSQMTCDLSVCKDTKGTKELLQEILDRLDYDGPNGKETYRDCSELKAQRPATPDGIYEITTEYSRRKMKVYCDMTSDEGKGWTVIQRRMDGSVNFTRNWFQYKYGFGDLMKEFWLGNDNIYHITNQDLYRLRIELTDFDNNNVTASYSSAYIGSEDKKYVLNLGTYIRAPSGDAGDSMRGMHNRKKFSTWDEDNDSATTSSCVNHPHYKHGGGWWFGNCDTANLNGNYLKDWRDSRGGESNIEWGKFGRSIHWIKHTVMKIRPVSDFN